jgi:hypothetical protein
MWQRQVTTRQMDDAFGKAYGIGVDLTVLDKLESIIEGKPTLGEHGELVLKGHYPTRPDQVSFEQKYLYEGIGWKLFGVSFNISKPTPATPAAALQPGAT